MLEFVEDGRGGVTVMKDGHPQSHVVLDAPDDLAFEYVDHLARVLDTLAPSAPAPLGVTHIGGAGLSLARYVQFVRPGSPQIVLEPDSALTEAVRSRLPLPRGHRIRVRAVDGRTGLGALRDSSADAVVVDAFADGRVPADLVTLEALAEVRRVLRPSGTALFNVADEPGLRYVARVLCGCSTVFEAVAFVGTHDVLKRRRFGNIVVVAGSTLDVDEMRRLVGRSPYPSGVRSGRDVATLARGARPLTDAEALRSPPPPDLGAWRIR